MKVSLKIFQRTTTFFLPVFSPGGIPIAKLSSNRRGEKETGSLATSY